MVPGAWDASVSSVTEGDGLDVVGPARTTPGGLAAAALAPGEVSQPGAWRATREPSSRSRLCSTVPTISSPHAPPSATARTRTTTSSVGAGYTMYSTASGVLTSPGSHLAGRLASSAGPISTGRSRRAELDEPISTGPSRCAGIEPGTWSPEFPAISQSSCGHPPRATALHSGCRRTVVTARYWGVLVTGRHRGRGYGQGNVPHRFGEGGLPPRQGTG